MSLGEHLQVFAVLIMHIIFLSYKRRWWIEVVNKEQAQSERHSFGRHLSFLYSSGPNTTIHTKKEEIATQLFRHSSHISRKGTLMTFFSNWDFWGCPWLVFLCKHSIKKLQLYLSCSSRYATFCCAWFIYYKLACIPLTGCHAKPCGCH